MPDAVICKSCGYVMRRSRLRDRCPACGVPSRQFQPYTDPMSFRRRLLLTLDIHPVLAHFPQAFTFSILGLSVAVRFLSNPWLPKALACLELLCLALPFTVALAFLAGLLDGRVRFRRVATPLLERKMALGSLFFLCSLGLALAPTSLPVITGLSAAAFACSAGLGWIGTKLLNSSFPG